MSFNPKNLFLTRYFIGWSHLERINSVTDQLFYETPIHFLGSSNPCLVDSIC